MGASYILASLTRNITTEYIETIYAIYVISDLFSISLQEAK